MEGPGGSLKLLTLKGGGCKRLLWTDYPLIIIVSSGNNILLGRKPLEKKNLRSVSFGQIPIYYVK